MLSYIFLSRSTLYFEIERGCICPQKFKLAPAKNLCLATATRARMEHASLHMLPKCRQNNVAKVCLFCQYWWRHINVSNTQMKYSGWSRVVVCRIVVQNKGTSWITSDVWLALATPTKMNLKRHCCRLCPQASACICDVLDTTGQLRYPHW